MTGIIIQARKGSTRLPNKMVLPFYNGKGVLELLIEKLINNFSIEQIVLATTDKREDDELVDIARSTGIKVFRGNETNVLDRFIKAADLFKFENIIRVCADNPFLEIPHIEILIKLLEQEDFEYISYRTKNGLPTIKSHLGLYTEAVTLEALKKVSKYTDESLYLEHVTNYIYENSQLFNITLLELPSYINDTEMIRLTLDTIQDFEYEKRLYKTSHHLSTKQLIASIIINRELMKNMSLQINKNSK